MPIGESRVFETTSMVSTGSGGLKQLRRSSSLALASDDGGSRGREEWLKEKWKDEAERRARHFAEPERRKYRNDPSWAHRGAVVALAFPRLGGRGPPEYSRLASCGVDGKVRTWDAKTGFPDGGRRPFDVECWTKPAPLQVDVHGPPEDVCLIPEDKQLAAYCTRSGELLCHLAAHTGAVTCAEALPGRKEVLTGGEDGRVLCWHALAGPEAGAGAIALDDG